MKIGLIAMSGVRVHNEELQRLGMTMPGIWERVNAISSLPSLSLLTLAALTPPDVEVEYREVRDLNAADLARDYDLVALSTMSAQAFEAYTLADRCRAMGVPVVMGGLHATALPDEVLEHCTSVVVGEGEPLWPRVVEDARRGRLARVYRSAPGVEYDLAESPIPRFDLLDVDRYNRLTVQTSRGCPHRCEFCASSVMLTSRYKVKPVERVIAEVRAIKARWRTTGAPGPFIEFADDNSLAMRGHYRRLLAALAAERVSWFTEADIAIADDPALLRLMHDSGCRQVLIGLESPSREGLDGIELRRNWKLRQLDRYEAAVRTIQAHGIAVNGCFILGLDGQTPAVFDAIYDFVDRTSLFDVQITLLTPFPGTPLYERLLREGRILRPGDWSRCTLFDLNIEPRGMSAQDLRQGFIDLASRLYDPGFVRSRRERFFRACPPRRADAHAAARVA